jgi:DNA-directed RNA polymerase subunit RPC12/RpoP
MVFGFGKKFKCDTCGAKFSTEAELKEHGKMHMKAMAPMAATGSQMQAMSFKCSVCGMSFSSQAELTEHDKRAHQKMAM